MFLSNKMLLTFVFIVNVALCKRCCSKEIIRQVWDGPGAIHNEEPHWSVEENALYWVDVIAQNVHRMDLQGTVTTRHIDYGQVGPVVTVKNAPGVILICVRTELFFVHWNSTDGDKSLRLLSVIDLGMPDNRCNDGKVDAKGRMWIGTLGKQFANEDVEPDQASLYLLSENNYLHPEVKLRPVSISNGIAWSKDNKLMYYIDSAPRTVQVFDFDIEKGSLSNLRIIFNFTSANLSGLPDGMTIDVDNNLWVANIFGGQVLKIDSRTGKLLKRYKIPAQKVTSVMWGGPNLDILYVTTSRWNLSPTELTEQPKAGSIFAIEGTGTKGLPANQFVFANAINY